MKVELSKKWYDRFVDRNGETAIAGSPQDLMSAHPQSGRGRIRVSGRVTLDRSATLTPPRSKSPTSTISKSDIAAVIAEKVGVTKKQAIQFFEAQAELAYTQAKNVFTIPGIGKLILVDRPARKMVMRFGADAGKVKLIAKSKKVKFLVAKAAKDSILGKK